ncbi:MULTISPECIES: SdpI family protein [Clostridium]|uniref:SdpI family protein n=1 Tax=Clostridium TaxID=1485 RepID=UPI000824BFF1|nr:MULTISPECIES: SdpI family protein [Clostridium]
MVSLIVAAVFIVCGFILMRFPPKDINGIYGYRTSFSMKSQDTWDTAQKYGGFSMIITGIANGIFGVWAIIQPIIVNDIVGQMIFLLIGVVAMFVIDEKYLHKIFNKDGSRRK